MASSRSSTLLNDKTTSISSSYTSSDELRRRRAAKTSVSGSPQRETNPLQHKPIVRSTSDSAAKVSGSTPLQTHSATANKSRSPGIARKSAEKPSSPSSSPLKSSSTASATAREKTPRPSSSSVSRIAASSKPASVSEKTTRALKAGVGGALSSAKARNPAGSVVSNKKKLSTSEVDADRRALSEDPSVTTDKDYFVVTSLEGHVSGENNHIAGTEAESIEAKEETLAETNKAAEEDDTNLESQPEDQHDSPEHELDGNIDHDGNRLPEIANGHLSEEPPSVGIIESPREEPCEVAKVEAETEGANLVMPDPCAGDAMPENREDDADQENSIDKSPAAESTVEKICVREARESKAPAPAPAEPWTATLVENGGETSPMVRVFKKPTLLLAKKEEKVSNDVIEETRSKLLEKKKSKVRALVGAFETVISLQDESQPGKN
ncbi:uncharacterized protein LOC121985554 [Zingiber officinale]|uniref:uncharacterized protein LOC121985554 n=1 Tax=Zingiber officinale TaxID=94328 RepID=UPI001C4C6BBB|nr:uncharacterized protein LOC121985554 [Zingiber officinale]XP_042395019.1 uncharacterized protein LOC121985554 [Zingiber officinale]XP_042395020.1 uncharacterized protein LOC121985554 [Zingiber officinale]